ncbi:hypothetical protein DC366_03090 [Pelagivirga sediminicola]|uniref:Type II restriction enzyme NaeI domain-containing protein n=1 Tax=Pelagivirga sediminicola TaxID=2170575 RepID=A0A2T7GBY1_9RHOB|nr:NaeI family type II restriction endonuclease [Pelagivirga sediminicola]PVA11924.1 hypothetical protein DC366_03090 [Pelagivirga sediminicola]
MKRTLPDSRIAPGHPDHALLSAIAADITARAGGADTLAAAIGAMLRGCVDDVLMTAKTGRRSYDELEKTEKTYIGTRVEIELRALLGLPKGRLDTVILGHDVDIKHTMGGNWMIPTEAVGHPCILVAADEARAVCHLGLIVARAEYLTEGQNKDAKRNISAAGFADILWLLAQEPYARNFWRTVPADAVARIFGAGSGNARMAALFREVQGRPIGRDVVEAVAQQRDFMRRIRADNGRGTRDHLAREGILLLSGQYDAALIAALGLRACTAAEFISHRPRSEAQAGLAARHGIAPGGAN